MSRFSEETFNSWRQPPSDSEETKLSNSVRLVREAILEDPVLNKMDIKIFAQGSYANDTNVKLNSDIDINLRLGNTFYYDLAENKKKEDYGYIDSEYTFGQYKSDVIWALNRKFGANYVLRNDKCITVKPTLSRVVTDVVPTFEYRRHDTNSMHKGSKFLSDRGPAVIGFPLQHIENGIEKNRLTQKRFKRTTRIFRRIRYKMIDEKVYISKNITSFLLECLMFNVPNSIFNNHNTWREIVRACIIFLYDNTDDKNNCKEWGEVSELLYLFHNGRKWTREDVNTYLVTMWNYLEFHKD